MRSILCSILVKTDSCTYHLCGQEVRACIISPRARFSPLSRKPARCPYADSFFPVFRRSLWRIRFALPVIYGESSSDKLTHYAKLRLYRRSLCHTRNKLYWFGMYFIGKFEADARVLVRGNAKPIVRFDPGLF